MSTQHSALSAETVIVANLMREQRENQGWHVELSIEAVPSKTGHYVVYDGLNIRSCGVTYNMRRSIEGSNWFGNLKRPIFLWKPDTDGTGALWLEGKIRCSHCKTETILDIEDLDDHNAEVHGIREECECDR